LIPARPAIFRQKLGITDQNGFFAQSPSDEVMIVVATARSRDFPEISFATLAVPLRVRAFGGEVRERGREGLPELPVRTQKET